MYFLKIHENLAKLLHLSEITQKYKEDDIWFDPQHIETTAAVKARLIQDQTTSIQLSPHM